MFRRIQCGISRPQFAPTMLAIAGMVVMLIGLTPPVGAQINPLTMSDLIGDAVSDLGPKYDDVDQALQRFQRGDVAGAHQFLVNAKQKHPQLPPPDVLLAKLQSAYRNAGAANALLERAVRGFPDDPEAYLMLADQAYAAGRLTESGCLYEDAATLVASMTGNEKRKRAFSIRTQAGRAAIAERRGDFDTAKGYLQAWVQEDPESATAHHRLGSTLFRLEDFKNAYDEFLRARQLQSSLPHPDVTSAKLFHQMGKQSDARQSFDRAIQQDGESAETRFAYAQWLMEIGEAPASQQHLEKARELTPDNPQLLLFSGVAAKMSGNSEAAEQFLKDAHFHAPASQDVLNQLALTLADSVDEAKRQRALQFAQVSSTLYPQNNESAVTLGWAYYKLDRLPEAERTIQNALRMGQLNSDSSYLIARILFEQAKVDDTKLDDAARILDSVVDDQGIFVHRQQAEELRIQIGRQRNN